MFDQRHEALADEFSVADLGTGFIALQDDRAVFGPAAACEFTQADFHGGRQVGGAFGLEPQLHRRGHFVDVLPPRTRGAHEAFRQLPIGQFDGLGDAQGHVDFRGFVAMWQLWCAGHL